MVFEDHKNITKYIKYNAKGTNTMSLFSWDLESPNKE